jgi:zinc and cadmium transporter
MSTLTQVIFFSLIGGLVSLIGGVLLLSYKKGAKILAEYATPFAAGALLAAAFLDLLREGFESGKGETVLFWALVGLLAFFVLQSLLGWFHHHGHDHKDQTVDPTVGLVITGDIIHNFIDGAAIAAAFLVSVPTGIVTTLAVAAHEIPQEIGDFGLMLSKGLKRGQVILVNVLSSLATVAAAILFFELGRDNENLLTVLLGLTAGFFIYIAASDIIPSIHESRNRRMHSIKTVLLLAGVLLVSVTTSIAHDYIETYEYGAESTHNT